MVLEAESQGYRHFLNGTFCNSIEGRTTSNASYSFYYMAFSFSLLAFAEVLFEK